MPLQPIQQRGRIAGITFGSRRTERLPVWSGRLRVYRKQYQVRIFGQQADQRSPRLFQTDGNRPAAEALGNCIAQTSTASGVFSISPCSYAPDPAGANLQKCFRSAQSMAANAAVVRKNSCQAAVVARNVL